jgi:orotidine-5'-phosphate decarboxylase
VDQVKNFADRFFGLAKKRSPLCVGIDPSPELLRRWGLPLSTEGIGRFCDIAMDAFADRLAVIKPQSAFFERFGPEGMREMVRLVGMIRDRGALALIDCKRGDVGHTLEAYAEAMIGEGSPFEADAITASPYLGFGALRPLLDRAMAHGAGVFVVVRSSNPEGRALQDARLEDGRTVASALADDITAFNASAGSNDAVVRSVGPVGAVLGATVEGPATETLARLPRSLLLAPGIGAQGATFGDLARNFAGVVHRVLPSVSRGVLAAGPSVRDLREAMERHRDGAARMVEGPISAEAVTR